MNLTDVGKKLGIIVSILSIFLISANLVNILLNKPDLTYEEDNHPIPGQKQSLVFINVKNEGHVTANIVEINVEVDGKIDNVVVEKRIFEIGLFDHEDIKDRLFEYKSTIYIDPESKSCQVEIPYITGGVGYTVYLIVNTTSDDPINSLIITSKEIKAKKEVVLHFEFFVNGFVLGICSTIVIIFLYYSLTLKKKKKR